MLVHRQLRGPALTHQSAAVLGEDQGEHDTNNYSDRKSGDCALQRYAERNSDTDADSKAIAHVFCLARFVAL